MTIHHTIIPGRILVLRPFTTTQYVGGIGRDALFKKTDEGWNLHLELGQYRFIVIRFPLEEKPPFKDGQNVHIIIEGETVDADT